MSVSTILSRVSPRGAALLLAFASSFVFGCGDGSSGVAGCGSDIDCKGDRICVDYVCVDPSSGDGSTDGGADPGGSTTATDDAAGPDDGADPDLPPAFTCFAEDSFIGTGETFLYSHAEMGATGIVHILDDDYKLIRRYDIKTDTFLEPWDTDLGATALAVSADGVDVYVGYEGGRIDHFDGATGTKQFFVAVAEKVLSMEVAEDWLFAIDPSGAWESHWLIRRSDGAVTAVEDWRSNSRGIVYSQALERVFTLRDGTSPNDIIMTDIDVVSGTLSMDQDSPYHGDYIVGHPLRLFPEEALISVSSGVIFNTTDLSYAGSFGLDYVDLRFHEDRIFLVEDIGGQAQLDELDQGFSIVDTTVFQATPERLFIHARTLVLFARCDGELGIYRRAL